MNLDELQQILEEISELESNYYSAIKEGEVNKAVLYTQLYTVKYARLGKMFYNLFEHDFKGRTLDYIEWINNGTDNSK